MRLLTLLSTAVLFTTAIITGPLTYKSTKKTELPLPAPQKIQVAILLDVSGSMDGLIEQAKSQLWNMVSVMGRAKCGTSTPEIEIALYEYGRTNNPVQSGYVKQISRFTNDLDKLSKDLFALQTNGGDEYCGQVIYTSLSDLNWSKSANDYKVIFIAGNEDFLQGNLTFTKACALAREKGVIVNTIYCGEQAQGIREHWNLAGECGNGSYTNIDHNKTTDDLPTPQDDILFTLNKKLNETYVHYGAAGYQRHADQEEVDQLNYTMSPSAAAKRVSVKGKSQLYNNATWDLVDAYKNDSTIISKVDIKTLPAEYKGKSRAEIQKEIINKINKRNAIQKEIVKTNLEREKFIAANKTKTQAGGTVSLETAVEKIIKEQAKRFKMVVE